MNISRTFASVDGSRNVAESRRMLTLLGNPTSHSLSPAIHNLSFQLLGIDAEYKACNICNEELEETVEKFRESDCWDGGNVTMPYKQTIVEHLDELDEVAQLIGAVNVLKKVDGKILGYNTDGKGLMADFAQHGIAVSGSRMVLLGCGGAGSAVLVQAALDGMTHVDVFARADGKSHRNAQKLIARLASKTACDIELYDFADEDDLRTCIQQTGILVNTTPIGMGSSFDKTPVPAGFLKPGIVVADAVYFPRETQLIADARKCGCITVPGLGMLLEQAAASEAIWYGVRMPVGEIKRQLF